jgi:hypothetical protein
MNTAPTTNPRNRNRKHEQHMLGTFPVRLPYTGPTLCPKWYGESFKRTNDSPRSGC